MLVILSWVILARKKIVQNMKPFENGKSNDTAYPQTVKESRSVFNVMTTYVITDDNTENSLREE